MKKILLIVLFIVSVFELSYSQNNQPINLGKDINTKYTELLPIISPDGKTLFFCRESDPANIGYNYNQADQDIWFSEIDSKGEWKIAKNIGNSLNNTYPNYLCSITPDGNMALVGNTYFYEDNAFNGVCITYRTEKGWSKPKKIKIENFVNQSKFNEYCLSMDGKKLLMAIQNSESFGEKDIFVSFRINDTLWSTPKNLGPAVNSRSSEISPFLAADDKSLYFASEGHPGFGMSDLFVSRRLDSTWTNWSLPENLGSQINSENWDAYFSLDAEGEWGYYSSYRNTYGQADIFKIKIPDSLRPTPVVLISGKVLNKKTKKPLDAKVIYEILPEGKEIGIARTNPKTGEYKITLPSGFKYGFRAEADSFLSVSDNIDLSDLKKYGEITRDLELVPIEKGETFVVNNLFFAYNDSKLNPDSYPELNRLAEFMGRNPKIMIKIDGHTDNQGSDDYNLELSKKRANSVKTYLVTQGVSKKRISTEGKGSKFPRNENDTDENMQKNRRVEMQIIESK
jgi:outer membrane protein OmpA-like peptidoglycan-associated protein